MPENIIKRIFSMAANTNSKRAKGMEAMQYFEN
jgi:hypothetical protein